MVCLQDKHVIKMILSDKSRLHTCLSPGLVSSMFKSKSESIRRRADTFKGNGRKWFSRETTRNVAQSILDVYTVSSTQCRSEPCVTFPLGRQGCRLGPVVISQGVWTKHMQMKRRPSPACPLHTPAARVEYREKPIRT